MPHTTTNPQATEAAHALSGVVRCYTLLGEMDSGPAPASAADAQMWAQTFEATWKEAQALMQEARALGWKGKLGDVMPGQPSSRARKIYATCHMVRLSVTRSAREALDTAAALVSGFRFQGEVPANLEHLHYDLAYALASAQIRAEKRSAGP
ncbi:hypothetical protein [Deinococcus sp. AJ005]|uniref:hypothetical protein n=1 Tax=Deinococcus sp. AJ005 TaxID=2652443 RepID=UPI00125CB56B|nr:hypothetical protein [Deinococcus sp. AJ005]QFP78536.1 hypothetical protein DAAJ005_18355 [Deinococcus sp. AJ005]